MSGNYPKPAGGNSFYKKGRKGKEEYLYSAILADILTKHSDMDHTVLSANYTMSAFPS